MPDETSRDSPTSSSPPKRSLHSSSPVLKSPVESNQPSLSPISPSSSPISSPLRSDALDNSFQIETVEPARQVLKRTIHQVESLEYEGPATRARVKQSIPKKRQKVRFQDEELHAEPKRCTALRTSAKQQVPEKKRKVHFQEEELDAGSGRRAAMRASIKRPASDKRRKVLFQDEKPKPESKRRHVTKASAKKPIPDTRRKADFENEKSNAKSSCKISRPQTGFLSGLDTPFTFNIADQSIFAKDDSSKELKAWARDYISTRDDKAKTLQNRTALGPEFGGSRASTPASFVSNTPSKRGRGSGRRGRGRGRGGRGRGGGRAGRNEDSPEPPKKRILTDVEKEMVADLKARQTELKKFFKEVGAHQVEALTHLTTRSLGKIARKSKAHEKVPEYQEVLDELDERRKEVEDLVRRKYEYELEQAKMLLEAEKEMIERRFKVSCSDTASHGP
jgi:hypothetical protein